MKNGFTEAFILFAIALVWSWWLTGKRPDWRWLKLLTPTLGLVYLGSLATGGLLIVSADASALGGWTTARDVATWSMVGGIALCLVATLISRTFPPIDP